jgi:hypothetical protein
MQVKALIHSSSLFIFFYNTQQMQGLLILKKLLKKPNNLGLNTKIISVNNLIIIPLPIQ